ncbi:MAG TPA: hypothetical protein VES39_06820, partial [Rhodospirillales bacterium]|nr:hypothetical protein [Rhodospirillales bacterium]
MKTMLLPYHDEEAARSALNAAILLAKRFGTHLQGLLVLGEPQLAMGTLVPGMPVLPEYLSQAADEWRRFADSARTDFLRITQDNGLPFAAFEATGNGPTAGWSEVKGREAEVIGEYGRVFDLIVVGRTAATVTSRWRDTCEAALFESGRPVLVAPLEVPPSIGRQIAIAWNGSVESARTVAFGLPLLHGAEHINVLSVEGQMVAGPPVGDLVAYLRRHGL